MEKLAYGTGKFRNTQEIFFSILWLLCENDISCARVYLLTAGRSHVSIHAGCFAHCTLGRVQCSDVNKGSRGRGPQASDKTGSTCL